MRSPDPLILPRFFTLLRNQTTQLPVTLRLDECLHAHDMRLSLPSLTYILVNDEAGPPRRGRPRYGKDDLRTCLVFAGWKPRVAARVVERSFLLLQERVGLSPADPASLAPAAHEMCPGVWGVRLCREALEELLLRCMPQKVTVTPDQRLNLQTAMRCGGGGFAA